MSGKKQFSSPPGSIFPVSAPVAASPKREAPLTAKIGFENNIIDQATSKINRMGLGKLKGGRVNAQTADGPSSWDMFTPSPASTMSPPASVSRAGKERHTDPFAPGRDTATHHHGKKFVERALKEDVQKVEKRKAYSRVPVDVSAASGPKLRPTGRACHGNSSNVSSVSLVDVQQSPGGKSAEGGPLVKAASPSRKPASSITELGASADTLPRRSSLRMATVVTNHPQKWMNDKPMPGGVPRTTLEGVWIPSVDRVARLPPAPAPFASTTESGLTTAFAKSSRPPSKTLAITNTLG